MLLINNNCMDSTAIVTENNTSITFYELQKDSSRFSTNLQKNSIIFIIGGNDYPTLLCYLASLEIGTIPLLLDSYIDQVQLLSLIQVYEPKFIFKKKATGSETLFGELIGNMGEYGLYIRNISDKFIPNENLALLLTTSGSTGSPKLVKISNKNLVSNAISISKYLDISENDRAITSLPFNYSYGLSVINSHLYSGGSIVLTNKSIMEGGFWDAVRNNSVTSFSGVPYSYEILLKLKIEKLDAPSIKKMTQAGGKLDSEKIEKIYTACRDNSIKFYTMYGQTEATARISYLPTEDTLRKPNSIGIAIPDGQLWLENKNGDIVKKAGVIGELVYQGANVSMGYAKNINDLTSGDVNCGVLKTGDLASFDEEGYFYIEGRKNRFIKVYGIRVSLDSLEKMVSKMGYTCAATGVDNKLLLYVVANLSDLSSEQLRMDIAGVLRINIIAIYINLVKELPRLETGKVDYNLLS